MLSTSSRENNYREETLLTDEISSSIKDGKIRGYECLSCASRGMEVQAYCGKCGSPQLKTIDLDTFGRIITYTIQHIAPEQFLNETPYAWMVIELDGGIRTTGWMPFINSPEELKIGQRVRFVKSYKPGMVFEKVDE